jgi:hypothetical protein
VDDHLLTDDTKLKNKNSRPLENILEVFHCIMDMKLEALYEPVQYITYHTLLHWQASHKLHYFQQCQNYFHPKQKKKVHCEGKNIESSKIFSSLK